MRRSSSVSSPSGGAGSSLKSPVWITVPATVRTASAVASVMEWVTRMGSISKGPTRKERPGPTGVRSSSARSKPCSASRCLQSSSACGGPKTGKSSAASR